MPERKMKYIDELKKEGSQKLKKEGSQKLVSNIFTKLQNLHLQT